MLICSYRYKDRLNKRKVKVKVYFYLLWTSLKNYYLCNMFRIYLEKIKLAVQKRTKTAQTQKSYSTWKAKGYENEPLVTFIFQTHNKSLQICHVLRKIRKWPIKTEVIVIDDGSSLDHTERLAKELSGANEFLVRCNDLYENVTYDKTIRMANGQYIALLQDDDDFADTQWMDDALNYFKQYPDMAILGGNWKVNLTFVKETEQRVGTRIDDASRPFCFAPSVNRAPMWINKALFDAKLRHIDFRFAPFQYDDDELCLRAWLEGCTVGWYDAGFHSLAAGGMRLWNNSFSAEQARRNGHLLYTLYADRMDTILQRVADNNRRLTE